MTPELRECIDRVPAAIREAAAALDYIGPTGLTSPAEIADCATDQLGEYACYLDPREFDELYVAVTRAVYSTFGIDSGASDGTDIPASALAVVAAGGEVRR